MQVFSTFCRSNQLKRLYHNLGALSTVHYPPRHALSTTSSRAFPGIYFWNNHYDQLTAAIFLVESVNHIGYHRQVKREIGLIRSTDSSRIKSISAQPPPYFAKRFCAYVMSNTQYGAGDCLIRWEELRICTNSISFTAL